MIRDSWHHSGLPFAAGHCAKHVEPLKIHARAFSCLLLALANAEEEVPFVAQCAVVGTAVVARAAKS